MRNRLCMKCMGIFDKRYEVCPYCGTIVGRTPAVKRYHLRPGTILQGRYVLGLALQEERDILYIGYDLQYGEQVLVEECYHTKYMARCQDDSLFQLSRKGLAIFRQLVEQKRDIADRLVALRSTYGIGYHLKCLQENKTLYVVKESIRGISLAKKLRSTGRLPLDTALPLILKLLQRVKLLHSAGIVHGRIDPWTIFLQIDGQVRILGLEPAVRRASLPDLVKYPAASYGASDLQRSESYGASDLQRSESYGASDLQRSESCGVSDPRGIRQISVRAQQLGSLLRGNENARHRHSLSPYAAPEQYTDACPMGPWTDVYSIAAVFYKMLTGQDIPDAIARSEGALLPSFSAAGLSLPRHMETAIIHALMPDHQERTRSTDRFIQELKERLQQQDSKSTT